MKTKRILGLILSAAMLLCGCEKEKAPATISLDATEIEIPMAGGSATVTVISNYPWEARSEADWLSFSPSKGDATTATVVTITALPNEGTNRISAVTFYGNNSRLCTFAVNAKQPGPKGEAGVAEQITVAEFIQRADGNTKYRLEGRISGIANASYFGFDLTDATGTVAIAFPTNFEDYANELVPGGIAVVEGTYQFYEAKKTHQMANGKIVDYTAPSGPAFGPAEGSGTKADPYNVAKAQEVTAALPADGKLEKVYVKGKISLIGEVDPGYGNATFYIADEGYYGEYYVYRCKYLGGAKFSSADQIKIGDEVVVYGTLLNYKGNTPEFTQGCELYSLNGQTSGGITPPSNITDVTVAEFLAKPVNNTDWYRLKGTVSGSINTTYGNFDVKDATGSVYFYGASNIADFKSKLVAGATITVVGNRGVYNDKDEVVNGYIESIEEGQVVPATPVASIAELIATAENTDIEIENVKVAAVTTKGYIAYDGQHAVHVYANAAPGVEVGDVVKFTGTRASYSGLPEVTGPKTTKTGTAEVSYPTPVDITASFGTYTASEAVYVKYSAKMVKSGNYTNFEVAGTDRVGSLTSLPSYEGISEGDQVVVYGFFNGINTNNNLLNVITVKIENTTTGKTIEYKSAGASGGGGGGGGGSTNGTITQDGNVHTADFSAQGYANASDFSSISNETVTIKADKASGNNGPKYYNTGTALRLYGGNTLTVSASKQIAKIEFTFSSGEGNNEITASPGSYAEGTWTGSANSVTFTIGGTTGHRRIKVIKVTLAE
ncbi:MAG: hypothetical protein K6D54_08275 [Bacteroidales bacterium]|nr:hypothetical protein [Bacteroidales bacterium]